MRMSKIINYITRRQLCSSSIAEPHYGAAEINKNAVKEFNTGCIREAIKLQTQAIKIKENRGDSDLEQFKEELEIFKDKLKPPNP